MYFPTDTVVAKEIAEGAETMVVATNDIPDDWEGLDVGPKSADEFANEIAKYKTII